MKNRTSKIWLISKEDLQLIVNKSFSVKEILLHFGLENKGNNYKTLKARLKEDCIQYDHIPKGLNWSKGRSSSERKVPLEKVLIENSTSSRNHLKKRLLRENLLENKCSICGQLPEWNGKPLSLQLDHINGISNDNRIENLRILCPHCHSQTENFAGRNKNEGQRIINRCSVCSEIISRTSDKCIKCNNKNMFVVRKTKASYPDDISLVSMINESSFVAVAKNLGVSDIAVRKRLKLRNLLHLIVK